MSVTYTEDRLRPYGEPIAPQPVQTTEEPFVPRYARTGRTAGRGKVKTWMILAPLGVVVLGGVALALAMNPGEETFTAPLVEPAATAPVLPAAPVAAAPVVETAPIVAAQPTPAPAARSTAPARAVTRAAPAPRAAAPTRRATTAPRVEAPVVAAPTSRPSTSTLNSAPVVATPAPAPAPAQPTPPTITVQPLG